MLMAVGANFKMARNVTFDKKWRDPESSGTPSEGPCLEAWNLFLLRNQLLELD
jgi:hypothetical protein